MMGCRIWLGKRAAEVFPDEAILSALRRESSWSRWGLNDHYLERDLEEAILCEIELYLRWLAKHEQEPDEAPPIGIILCAGKSKNRSDCLSLAKVASTSPSI
jgi:hypothetical protein